MQNSFRQYQGSIRQMIGSGNLKFFFRFFIALLLLILIYSFIFQVLQAREGKDLNWFTGFYWTLTTMTTLGYGDIVFTTDSGRAFSLIVLLTGLATLILALPVAFVEFIYRPWLSARSVARAPRTLHSTIQDHVLLTHYDEVTRSVVDRLDHYGYQYAFVLSDLDEVLNLHDLSLIHI